MRPSYTVRPARRTASRIAIADAMREKFPVRLPREAMPAGG